MVKGNKKGQRKPVNKPVEFIQRLEILNLLPENLDEFLQEFSALTEKFRSQQKTLKKYRAANLKRTKEGKNIIKPTNKKSEKLSYPDELCAECQELSAKKKREKLLYPYITDIKSLYSNYFETLPTELKKHIELEFGNSWEVGEQLLNMLAVERESLELIIYQQKIAKEFKKDFEDWKSNQKTELSEKALYYRFCDEMKHFTPTREKYNAGKYETHIPSINLILLLPNIDQRLFHHRIAAAVERKGFKGFFTHLIAKDGCLDVWAQGLMGILIKQKLTGGAPIEIDRLRRCEFCIDNLVYAYKDNQRYCSANCRSAASAQRNRNSVLSSLQKRLKKATVRLEKLKELLHNNHDLVKEQNQEIEEIQNLVNEEKKKNGNLS